ncbi:MAG: clathrin light chain-domain-containing protein [Benniella sp.]|nr:MAG: clathrin light chain-domain-containing protein [Benniella sp.]
MDDFGFDAPSSKKTDFGSDDPTADFLAREQAALGGDADFLASLASVGSTGLTSTTSPSNNNIGSDFESNFPSFADHEASLTSPPVSGRVPSVSTPSVNVAADDDDFGAFHSEYPAIETTDSTCSFMRTYHALPHFFTFLSIQHREHREKQAVIVAERDEKSEAKRQQTINAAHEAIDRFYEDYNQKKAKSIAENRDKETAFLAKRDDVSSGTQWERINRHLDSSPAAVTAALKAGRRDTTRMRELLRDLEKDPSAPGK